MNAVFRKWPILLLVAIAASPAFAVVDPDPDIMGVYFDPNAEIVCSEVATIAPLDLYILLTNGTAPNVSVWAAQLQSELFGSPSFIGSWSTPGCFDIAGTDQDGLFEVGCGPVPTAPVMLLAQWSGLYVGDGSDVVTFTLGGFPDDPLFPTDTPAYIWEDPDRNQFLQRCGVPVANPSLPCAMLNVPDCAMQVIPTESSPWGVVKALYR